MTAERISAERPWRRYRRAFAGTAPAAGADWSVTVPAGVVWDVLSIVAGLTTAVAAGNRAAVLSITDADTVIAKVPPAAVQAASLAYDYTWFDRASGLLVGTTQGVAIPSLRLPAGAVLASSTASLQAADQWTAPTVYVIETMVRLGDIALDDVPDIVVELFTTPGA